MMLILQMIVRCLMRTIRTYCRFMIAGAVITVFFVVFNYNPFPAKLRVFTSPCKKQDSGEPNDTRPRAYYPWISDSGHTLNGTKPPVHGVFILLDLDSSSYVTLQRDGDTLVEQLTEHDFGFSSCNQVWRVQLYNV